MKVSNSVLEELIVKHKGFVTQICKAAGISRQTFYNRIEKNDKLKAKLDASREEIIDFAESKLLELIREKHYPSIRFYLETQGKSKGYVVRQEVDQNTTIKSILEVPELEAYEPTIDDIREH
jgi:AcrR family transcriptional regulator